MKVYDEYAKEHDAWFLENQNLLQSEVKLVAHFMRNPGKALSIGCGSGLFEMILEKEYEKLYPREWNKIFVANMNSVSTVLDDFWNDK